MPRTKPRRRAAAEWRAVTGRVIDRDGRCCDSCSVNQLRFALASHDGTPDDRLIWECETGAELVAPRALPNPSTDAPMPHADFDALVRATRWTALTPFVDPDGEGPLERLPITAPFHGAVEVEDFQLVPPATR